MRNRSSTAATLLCIPQHHALERMQHRTFIACNSAACSARHSCWTPARAASLLTSRARCVFRMRDGRHLAAVTERSRPGRRRTAMPAAAAAVERRCTGPAAREPRTVDPRGTSLGAHMRLPSALARASYRLASNRGTKPLFAQGAASCAYWHRHGLRQYKGTAALICTWRRGSIAGLWLVLRVRRRRASILLLLMLLLSSGTALPITLLIARTALLIAAA